VLAQPFKNPSRSRTARARAAENASGRVGIDLDKATVAAAAFRHGLTLAPDVGKQPIVVKEMMRTAKA